MWYLLVVGSTDVVVQVWQSRWRDQYSGSLRDCLGIWLVGSLVSHAAVVHSGRPSGTGTSIQVLNLTENLSIRKSVSCGALDTSTKNMLSSSLIDLGLLVCTVGFAVVGGGNGGCLARGCSAGLDGVGGFVCFSGHFRIDAVAGFRVDLGSKEHRRVLAGGGSVGECSVCAVVAVHTSGTEVAPVAFQSVEGCFIC